MNATGCGARPDMDGVDVGGSYFATMSDCSDVEITESDRPFLYVFRNFFQNHGLGKFRGGNGMGFGLEVHGVPWLFMGCQGYGSKFPASMGVFGGYAAATSSVLAIRQPNLKELQAQSSPDIPTNLMELFNDKPLEGNKIVTQITTSVGPYSEGDVIFVSGGGGAGYGDVLERDPESVVQDVKLGRATPWQARNVYKVAYDETTLRVNTEETNRLRDEERASRLKLSVSYDQFESEWLKKSLPAEILKYYGTYPNPSAGLGKA